MNRGGILNIGIRSLAWGMLLVLLVTVSAGAFTRRSLDGQWQYDYGGGWSYIWYSSGDYEHWKYNGNLRFAYTWYNQAWWYQNGLNTWYGLTGGNYSQDFVGDGAFRMVGNNWWFGYDKYSDRDYWSDGSASAYRFAYSNTMSRWTHCYGTTWSALTSTGYNDASFIGNGGWHNIGANWWYAYTTNTNQGFWNDGGTANYRFAYNYDLGRWVQYGISWSVLTSSGYSNSFIGDGGWHDIGTIGGADWWYAYTTNTNQGFWSQGSSANYRFTYNYDLGRWVDYTVNGWGRLGALVGMAAAFIGDGTYHTWTGGDSFLYRSAEDTYYWNSGGTDWYRYNFAAQTWEYRDSAGGSWYSMTYGGSAQNPDCRYLYDGLFVERGLYNDTGDLAPSGRKELHYDVYRPRTNWDVLASWKIHRAGSDNNWSGGDLNIAWGNTRHWDGAWLNDFNQRYGEFTAEDVIFFAADFEQYPIGFATMVDWMTWVRDYYGTQIRTVAVLAHGNSTGWEMGQWMDRFNYTNFQDDWVRWGNLMTADGQLVSIHCEVGQAAAMLNAIAGWSGMDIFANTNLTWNVWWWLSGSDENSSIWNSNYNQVTWYDNSSSYMDRYFEYTTTGSQNYRWILQY